ncbi:MAG: hypothetical protein EOO68_33200 [Moraxellaceae bacterium]|jgi:hypothetical protein|nr:MAG: hypothetical protein EOO68_33200 [Moraxellaceae bacterium]
MSTRLSHAVFTQPELLTGLFDACVLDGSAPHLEQLQEIIDALHQLPDHAFTPQTQTVLHQLLTHPAWGGRGLAYNHSAERLGQAARPLADLKETWFYQLQQHYAAGSGNFLAGSRVLFGQSQLVQACCRSLKKSITTLRQAGKPFAAVSTEAKEFLASPEAMALEKQGNRAQSGYIFADGSLVLEHKDDRAARIFDRFIISASTSANGGQLMTRWKLFGQYVFGLPEQLSAHAELLLSEQLRVRVPLTLVARAQDLGIAKGFYYGADWMETWAG